MLSSILVLSIISGLFFRSLNAFYITGVALFSFIFPIPTLALIICVCAYFYFKNKGEHHEPSKSQLHSSKSGDDLNE